MSSIALLTSALMAVLAAASPAGAGTGNASEAVSFARNPPPAWELGKEWRFDSSGAMADAKSVATRNAPVPEACWIEAVVSLPDSDALAKGASLSISVGPLDGGAGRITASGAFARPQGTFTLAGIGGDGKPLSTRMARDTRPSMLRQWKEAEKHGGWAGQTVSLGLAMHAGRSRLLINGCVIAESSLVVPAQRRLPLSVKGLTLRTVRVLDCPPVGYAYLTGAGVAAFSGGACTVAARGSNAATGTDRLDVLGIPMLVRRADAGLVSLDVAAERWGAVNWSEGKGFLMAPVPARPYAAAYLLLHRAHDPGKADAMGFGLRPPEMSAGDMKNVYLDARPAYRSDDGVTVQSVPALGDGWYLARVPMNPAALHWYSHKADGSLRPVGLSPLVEAYFCRPWSNAAGLPRPEGKPSSLAVAAVTLEEARIDLTLMGNGLGNVYAEPQQPQVSARVRNTGSTPLRVRVLRELTPYGMPPLRKSETLDGLQPGETRTLDALAEPIRGRGHYRLRVVADAGAAGQIDYRTNVALLAPNTRQKIDSPFGCWSALWSDGSTESQRSYLKENAGVAFVMGKHHFGHRMDAPVPDDAAAEAIVRKLSPEVKIFMLGWEHTWTNEQTFALPRVITEGQPEQLSKEINDKVDRTAVQWRRLASAIRRLRPDVKISLGNSAVNFSVPFLERGFQRGVEFDYFGTEEGLFDEMPEQPADAIGNVSWWARKVCEHFGSRDVPLFHSETVYYPTGIAFSRMAEATQAANLVRTYLLGYPYRSIFGFSAAMVDASNRYIYSQWGMSGYCNQAPECSPKLSYVAYATLTQVLDGARYEGRLETGTTSLYALRFRRPDKGLLYVLWNLRGRRQLTARLDHGSKPEVVDAIHRSVNVAPVGSDLTLTVSELPIYVSGVTIHSITPGPNVPGDAPDGQQVATLDDPDAWTIDSQPDKAFEAPREWRGVPKVRGQFEFAAPAGDLPGQTHDGNRLTLTLKPLAGTHGLIPRYVSLRAKPGNQIAIPKGTTRLAVWVRGNSTWAQVKLGIKDAKGRTRLLLDDDFASRMADNFDGWRLLETGDLGDEELPGGQWKLDRIVVTMPEQQVYIDELRTTPNPQISIWGLRAIHSKLPVVNYLPW